MAELAIVGGLAAVLQLSSSARKFTSALYQVAVDAGAATAEIQRFALQVDSFSMVTRASHITLSCYCNKNRDSRLVQFLVSNQVLRNIGSEAKVVDSHLRHIWRKIESLRSRSTLWAYIKWSFSKSSVMKLSPEMESVKTSLNLLATIVHVDEVNMRTPGDARAKRAET
jgi:hypothetical protein